MFFIYSDGCLSCMNSSFAVPFAGIFILMINGICLGILCVLQESVQVMRSAMNTDVTDLVPFFWDHLRMDLTIIGKSLSHGENETLMVLHRIIHHVAGMQPTIGKCTGV